MNKTSRREWLAGAGSAAAGGLLLSSLPSAPASAHFQQAEFRLRFILASPLYGTTPLAEVLC